MDLEIIIYSESRYIEFVTKGVLDKENSMEMAKTISETMRRHLITRALIDHRNVTIITGDVMDVYERPKIFHLLGMLLGIKIAELITPVHSEHFGFLETVCVNQGIRFSVFYDRTKALAWLLH
jgi:hypothetical protein